MNNFTRTTLNEIQAQNKYDDITISEMVWDAEQEEYWATYEPDFRPEVWDEEIGWVVA